MARLDRHRDPRRGAPEGGRRPPGTLTATGIIAGNDLRRRLRDRSAVLLGIVAPLVLGGLIGVALGGIPSFSARIAVVDADRSPLSRAIVGGLVDAVPADGPLRLVPADDEARARADLDDGTVGAVLVVPAGFGASVMAGPTAAPLPLTVVTDAGRRVSGAVARSLADSIAARVDAGRLGVATALALPPPPGAPADPAERLPALVAAVPRVEPALDVTLRSAGDPYRPIAFFGASMGILFLFFTMGAGARSVLAERDEGTLARVRAAPVGDRSVLLGKAASNLLLGLASMVTIWLVTTFVFRASWGDPAAVLAVIVASLVAVAGFGSLVTGLARTNAQAEAWTSLLAFVLALLGGGFQPLGTQSGAWARLALLTPNGWALRAFTRVGAADAGVLDILPALAALVAMGAVTLAIGVRLLGRKALP
jgi:ABC-2 type transport system permease protein